MQKISVIIPAFNESAQIEKTLRETYNFLRDFAAAFKIIVVDDGSQDETLKKIESLSFLTAEIIILQNEHRGKAGAVAAGVARADGDYVLMMDADGAVGVAAVKRLLQELKERGADIAIGSREGPGAQRINEPFYRHWLGRVFNTVVKLVTGLRFEDTQCGFKLFKTEVIKKLSKESRIMNRRPTGLKEPLVTAFDVELLVLAQKFGYKTIEVPILWHHVKTRNINPVKDSLRMLADVLATRLNLLRGKYD